MSLFCQVSPSGIGHRARSGAPFGSPKPHPVLELIWVTFRSRSMCFITFGIRGETPFACNLWTSISAHHFRILAWYVSSFSADPFRVSHWKPSRHILVVSSPSMSRYHFAVFSRNAIQVMVGIHPPVVLRDAYRVLNIKPQIISLSLLEPNSPTVWLRHGLSGHTWLPHFSN